MLPAILALSGVTLCAQAPADEAEQTVRAHLGNGRIVVLHFWAPWCLNSSAELRSGWYEIVEDTAHTDVEFIFATVWNDGQSGRETLDHYAIPSDVLEVVVPDAGPSDVRENRLRSFLDLPLTWIPSTWIFHPDGQLAYAFNYGEIRLETLRQAIADTRNLWHRD